MPNARPQTQTDAAPLIQCRGMIPTGLHYDFTGAGLDLDIRAGEIVCLLGPERSSKSKWLKALCGLQDLQQGSVSIDGLDSTQLSAGQWTQQRRNIAYVHAETALLSAANGLQNTLLPAFYHRLDKKKKQRQLIVEQALDLLEAIDPGLNLDDLPAYISKEQRFKIAVARALLLEPELLALNRPFTHFDHDTRHRFQQFLQSRVEQGLTLLMITQETGFALAVSDRIVFISPEGLHCFDSSQAFRDSSQPSIQEFLQYSR